MPLHPFASVAKRLKKPSFTFSLFISFQRVFCDMLDKNAEETSPGLPARHAPDKPQLGFPAVVGPESVSAGVHQPLEDAAAPRQRGPE
jgi:hypothetical protein